MNKRLLFLIILFFIPFLYSDSTINSLTEGRARQIFCEKGGSCNLSFLYAINTTITNINLTGSLNVVGNASFEGEFTTPCMHCDGNNTYFHGDGIFEGNVTAPNIEVMESLIVHGNSTCSGTAVPCGDAMFIGNPFLCGWTIYTGQRGCRWHWGSGTCIGTATPCSEMSTATCTEQHNCLLTTGDGFVFGSEGFIGNVAFQNNVTIGENLYVNESVYSAGIFLNGQNISNLFLKNGTGENAQLGDINASNLAVSENIKGDKIFSRNGTRNLSMDCSTGGLCALRSATSIYDYIGTTLVDYVDSTQRSYGDNIYMRFGVAGTAGVAPRMWGDWAYQINPNGNKTGSLTIGLSNVNYASSLGLMYGRYALFVDSSDMTYNFAHPQQANPTIFIHSNNQSTSQWISMSHNTSDGKIETGNGSITLKPENGNVILNGNLDVKNIIANKVILPSNTTGNSLEVGTFGLQSYAVNNAWLSDNLYYNLGFKYRTAGYGVLFYFAGREFQIRTAGSGTADATAIATVKMKANHNGAVGLGGNISINTDDFSGAFLKIDTAGNTYINNSLVAYNSIGINTENQLGRLNIILNSSNKYGVYIDGATNDYNANASAIPFYMLNDYNWGNEKINGTYGTSINSYYKNTNASINSSMQWMVMSPYYSNTGKVTNKDSSAYSLYIDPMYFQAVDTGNWDTISTGTLGIYNRGFRVLQTFTPYLNNTGNNNINNIYSAYGVYVSGYNNPIINTSAGTWYIYNYGNLMDIISKPTILSGNANIYSYGNYISVVGNASGNSAAYGINIATVTGADNNYAIYDNSDRGWYLDGDNSTLYFGEDNDIALHSNGNGRLNIIPLADTDLTLNFSGTSGDGIIKWMEDENEFDFQNNVNVSKKLNVKGNTTLSGGNNTLMMPTLTKIDGTTPCANGDSLKWETGGRIYCG